MVVSVHIIETSLSKPQASTGRKVFVCSEFCYMLCPCSITPHPINNAGIDDDHELLTFIWALQASVNNKSCTLGFIAPHIQ